MESILVLDAGTTGIRSILFSLNGEIICSAYQELSSMYPHPAWVEQDANDWWNLSKLAIKSVLRQTKNKDIEIMGIVITNQRETIVPVDRNGDPLHNALVWQDRRTTPQCKILDESIGSEKIYQITGLTIDPYFSATKIAWIIQNNPKIVSNTQWFFLVHDFLVFKLTGVAVTDWANASRTMLFDIHRHEWSNEIIEQIGISGDQLPTPVPSAKLIKRISPEIAQQLGLSPKIPVISGGGDQQCAAVGVGVTSPKKVKVTTGTGSFILGFTGAPILDPKRQLLCSCHAIPNAYVVEASVFTTGAILRWLRDQIASEEQEIAQQQRTDVYDIMDQEASKIPPGSNGLIILPHFVGAGSPYWYPQARGAIIGLALGHTRQHLIRGVLEACYLEVARNLQVMMNLGINIEKVHLTGGGSRSAIWNQIAADICNLPVWTSQVEEATALGAAILGSVGVKHYSSFKRAENAMIHTGSNFEPNPVNQEVYQKLRKKQDQIMRLLMKNKIFED